MPRYEVTVTRKLLVYGEDAVDAMNKARSYVVAGAPCLPTSLTLDGKEIPDVLEEKHEPIIDRAPSRETRVG